MRRLLRIATTLLLGAAVLAGLGLVVPALLGFERYVIVSGSMSGSYDRGSLVFAEVVPVRDLRVGDVITYRPPPGAGPSGLVTHRIVECAGRDVPHARRRQPHARPVDVPPAGARAGARRRRRSRTRATC